jgi:hypothetical protein
MRECVEKVTLAITDVAQQASTPAKGSLQPCRVGRTEGEVGHRIRFVATHANRFF